MSTVAEFPGLGGSLQECGSTREYMDVEVEVTKEMAINRKKRKASGPSSFILKPAGHIG